MIAIGIDPGVNTGIAVWDVAYQRLVMVSKRSILEAMQEILIFRDTSAIALVIFEDARMIRIGGGANFGNAGRLQGAGSVKRDCSIWEEFLIRHALPYHKCRNQKKLDDEKFVALTRWQAQTNKHSRDAAMLVYGLTASQIQHRIAVAENERAFPTKKRGANRRRNSPAL